MRLEMIPTANIPRYAQVSGNERGVNCGSGGGQQEKFYLTPVTVTARRNVMQDLGKNKKALATYFFIYEA